MADSPDALVREAVRLQREGRAAEAIDAYRRVLARFPSLADCWYNLGILERGARQLHEALDSYQRALDLGISRPEDVHLNRSVIYTDYLHEHAAAERELLAALAWNPSFPPALLNLANLYEDTGRREEAFAVYSRILATDPHAFEALARFANLQVIPGAYPDLVAALRRALTLPEASPAERASLGFALGRLLDAAGDYAAAFAAYASANEASRASAPDVARHDRALHTAFIDRLVSCPVPPARQAAAPPPQPIFICGMFRSGSTLAEQLLTNLPGVAAGGELEFLPRLVATELAPFPESLAALGDDRLAAIADRYRAELARIAPGAAYVIDKRPDNFLYVGLIKRLFPQARIVHTTRAPLDNCLSIFFLHLDQRMSYALDLMDIGHYFREYRRLMTHWKAAYGADIHDLDYDLLVREPVPTLERLCAFLGLEWGGRAPAPVPAGRAIKTASVWQVREPLYRRSSGRARHYATELRPLAEYLEEAPP